MEQAGSRVMAYAIDPSKPIRLTLCGVRAPTQPWTQHRRQMSDFIAFMVIKDAIDLIDELPDGTDRFTVPAGEIHLVAPDAWQASIRPFPPGMVFLWFHFSADPFEPLDQAGCDTVVRDLFKPGERTSPQRRWLIPRHFALGDEIEAMTRLHGDLLENERLWGLQDEGTQVIGRAMVYRLHRAFAQSRLMGQDIMRSKPEFTHVARARAFIRLNHERPISLAKVAEEIGLNPSYLSRCFSAATGGTVGDAIFAARLTTAKRLLSEGHSVKETAFLAGFGSASYFCRMFRGATGLTPIAYLEKYLGRRGK